MYEGIRICVKINIVNQIYLYFHSQDDRFEFVKHLPLYCGATGRKLRKFSVCSAKSSYYCVVCSKVKDNDLYGCCEPAMRDCFKIHLDKLGFA